MFLNDSKNSWKGSRKFQKLACLPESGLDRGMKFYFSGEIPASKSVLNRLLVIKSFSQLTSENPSPTFKIHGDSQCDDVFFMKSALPKILAAEGDPAQCGAAGTVFRFLALRASRIPGRHVLTGTPGLLSRPHEPLIDLIKQLGCSARLSPTELVIDGTGWKKPSHPLKIDRSQSSQFASALFLNAWELDFNLEIEMFEPLAKNQSPQNLSQGYLEMTFELVRKAGLALESPIDRKGETYFIPKNSVVKKMEIHAEPDYSSAFAIAALAALSGEAIIKHLPVKSIQPDAAFPDLLQAMGVDIQRTSSDLQIYQTKKLKPITSNLSDSPDLFPILAVLCAYARGKSKLFGAPHLAHKESSRIKSTAELLKKLGCSVTLLPDGLEIEGGILKPEQPGVPIIYDPHQDHRLAMAAAVAHAAGSKIQISDPNVVTKSFPEFWEIYPYSPPEDFPQSLAQVIQGGNPA